MFRNTPAPGGAQRRRTSTAPQRLVPAQAAGESAFNATELEQIEMIENYRAKLVEDASETSAAERGKDLSKIV